MSIRPINLICALPAEAKSIASRLGLARVQPDRGFAHYRGGAVSLLVTGPGKINAAAGTAFLGALGDRRHEAVWVNLGVAGHAERSVGAVLLANRVTDASSGQVWYPNLLQVPPCGTDSLLTLERPDASYPHAGMVDMEASGFFPTACRFSGIELVQVLKVVSDNRRSPVRGLSGKQVRALMGNAVEPLGSLIAGLAARMAGQEGRGGARRATDWRSPMTAIDRGRVSDEPR
jgi:hypothetical protein